jgi:hypothetical protein
MSEGKLVALVYNVSNPDVFFRLTLPEGPYDTVELEKVLGQFVVLVGVGTSSEIDKLEHRIRIVGEVHRT